MKKLIICMLILAALASLCSCTHNDIPDVPDNSISEATSGTDASINPDDVTVTTPTTVTDPPEPDEILKDRTIMSELAGSFLTMRMANSPNEALNGSYVKVFDSYAEMDSYFTATDPYFMYGQKFIRTLVSFDDVFMSKNDVMFLKLDDNSSYISHKNIRIKVEDGKLVIGLERHAGADVPLGEAQYHLVITAPKGAFSGLDSLPLELEFTDIIDDSGEHAADAERFLYIYPEYVPFVYRTDAGVTPSVVIDTISSYDSLVAFYEKYKDSYNLDELKKHIGSLYSEDVFDDYTLLVIMLPSSEKQQPKISDLFVYSREVYVTIKNTIPAVVSETTPCHLMITAVSKKELQSVNLRLLNISFE